jgi:hypothetical protein
MVFWKQNDILLSFSPLSRPGGLDRKSGFVCRAWFVEKFEMILLEFCEPVSLSTINFLWLAEILEVLVIYLNFKMF